ncbi:MAG: 50S ribosomal protein L7 [Lawsonibacter sp.]|nr:50S ribosomal protein L7 [Lawsonibacter sp.]
MLNDPVLHLLGLAKKAGRLEVGEEPVGAACRARQAKLVLLAADAAPNTRRRAAHFGDAGNVLWLETPFDKAQLGFLLGRSSCAMLALTDAGFSAAIVEKLAARDPDKYGPAARQLRTRADRVLQRQREQRQHEKNLRQGKHKPWAPPPKEEGPSQRGRPRPQKAARRSKDGPAPSQPPGKGRPAGRRLTGTFRKP